MANDGYSKVDALISQLSGTDVASPLSSAPLATAPSFPISTVDSNRTQVPDAEPVFVAAAGVDEAEVNIGAGSRNTRRTAQGWARSVQPNRSRGSET